jgi:hypothetical protein
MYVYLAFMREWDFRPFTPSGVASALFLMSPDVRAGERDDVDFSFILPAVFFGQVYRPEDG